MGKSDHAMLELNVQVLVKKEPKYMEKKIAKIDIPKTKHYLGNDNCDWSVIYNTADPDVTWKIFRNIVNSIITTEITFFVKVNLK